MNADRIKENGETETVSQHRIALGHYDESMYYIDMPAVTSAYDQSIIDGLLTRNHGVGVIAGCFDQALSIRMVSGFAGRLLGYYDPEALLAGTQAGFLRMALTDEALLRSKLADPDGGVWSCTVKGKDGSPISVRISNVVGTRPDGEKMWYLTIRRLGEPAYDTLTGNYNRYGFISCVNTLRDESKDLTDHALVFINIRDFKAINDLYGAGFGDQLLIGAYRHFSNCALKPVVCARSEADNYVLLVKRETLDPDGLPELLKIPYKYGDKQCYAESLCGIYYIEDETEVSTMIDNARIAMQGIKDAFVKPFAVFKPSMRAEYLNKAAVLTNLDEALERNEFKVYYQPVVDCVTGKVMSAEALIRWESRDGLISPSFFISTLEENGRISKLDEYVMNSVVSFLHRRARNGMPLIPVSINVSRMDFFDVERTQRVYALLERDPIARNYTHFEITETSYRSIKELQAEFIRRINACCGMVYIDDYGEENNSITMLSQYDFAVLKLDMKLIRDMVENAKVRTLIESTILMAHKLSMKVIAEGVETEEQLEILRSFDCDYIQGYYFSRPLNERAFSEYLSKHRYGRIPTPRTGIGGNGAGTDAAAGGDGLPQIYADQEATSNIFELLPATAVISFRRSADRKNSFLYANERARRMLGDDKTGCIDLDGLSERIHPEDRAWIWKRIRETVYTQRAMEETYRLITRNRQTVWVRHVAAAVPEPDGGCTFYVTLTDVSFRKTVEDWKTIFCRCYPSYFENRFNAKDVGSVLRAVDLQSAMLRNVADQYSAVYIVNLKDDSLMEISCMQHVKETIKSLHGAGAMLERAIEQLIAPEFREQARAFYDLATLPERLLGKSELSMDYNACAAGWCRGQIIPVVRDEAGLTEEAVLIVQRIQAERIKVEHLHILAETDSLSQLRNRIGGERDINRYLKEGRQGMFCVFDVENFRYFNDRYGRTAGDEIIQLIGTCIKQTFRGRDVLMRVGGGRFAIYAPGILNRETSDKRILELTQQIRRLTFERYQEDIRIGAEIIFTAEQDHRSFEQLLVEAETRKNGRSRDAEPCPDGTSQKA